MVALSERQKQVLKVLSEGINQKEAAAKLGVIPSAINQTVQIIIAKAGSLEHAMDWYLAELDELPDDDEPYGPWQRCHCGLTLPCNHENMTVSLAGSSLGDVLEKMIGDVLG